MPLSPIITVTAFVDWNSQIHAARLPELGENEIAKRTLDYVARAIGRVLSSIDSQSKFDVTLRIYHGWHKGFEPTPRRKAMIAVAAGADFSALSCKRNVLLRNIVEYGDRLISAFQERTHHKLGCQLANTLRRSERSIDALEEKMVDTAIASDVVDTAHRDRQRWIVVVGDDDDLVPPVYVAEAVRNNNAGRVILIRTRPETPFLKLDKLHVRP